jgi:hypothetical protein
LPPRIAFVALGPQYTRDLLLLPETTHAGR